MLNCIVCPYLFIYIYKKKCHKKNKQYKPKIVRSNNSFEFLFHPEKKLTYEGEVLEGKYYLILLRLTVTLAGNTPNFCLNIKIGVKKRKYIYVDCTSIYLFSEIDT